MHKTVEPKILYFGTPVVLVSTLNEDGTYNLAPISSAWWINQSCMLGMSSKSQTVENLIRERQCVLNLPSENLVGAVDKLALLTGKYPVPDAKLEIGYQHEPDKFGKAKLTPSSSDMVNAPVVRECPIQLEAVVEKIHPFDEPSSIVAIEAKIICAHIDEEILLGGDSNYIDAEKWKPLIMNFCEFFGLSSKLHPSRLAAPFTSKYYND